MGRCIGGDVFIDCTKRALVPASVISSWRSRLSSHAESLQYSRNYATASCSGERKGLLKCRGKPVLQRCPKQATRAVQGRLHRFRPNREQRRRFLDAHVLHFTHDEDYAKPLLVKRLLRLPIACESRVAIGVRFGDRGRRRRHYPPSCSLRLSRLPPHSRRCGRSSIIAPRCFRSPLQPRWLPSCKDEQNRNIGTRRVS
jgi:hypothetical protein